MMKEIERERQRETERDREKEREREEEKESEKTVWVKETGERANREKRNLKKMRGYAHTQNKKKT